MAPRKKQSREEILQKKREAERARRERIRNDPEKRVEQQKKEQLRYIKKKEKGLRKSIKNMTTRAARQARKKWKKYSSDYRRRQALIAITNTYVTEITPPPSDDEIPAQAIRRSPNSVPCKKNRLKEAKRRSEKQRKLRLKEIKKKDNLIRQLQAKIQAQRKKYKRLKHKCLKESLTPKSKIEQMAEDENRKRELVKKALFGEVIETQLAENYSKMKTNKEKESFKRIIAGEVVDKYKIWRFKPVGLSYKKLGYNKRQPKKNNLRKTVENMVTKFYEDDINSRQSAGKKEFITRKNVKKQKRYLLDSSRNLHKMYLKSELMPISYSLFCRLRPFWVVPPKISDRDTCMCILHANMDLKLIALRNHNIITFSNHQTMLQHLCCDRYSEECLERTCTACNRKSLPYQEFDNSKVTPVQAWIHDKVSITDLKTKKQRFVIKYKKITKEKCPRDLILQLENDFQLFFKHELNIVHQYSAIKNLKKSLTNKDTIIHMDFSENFTTKYNKEIQAFHFGGSRNQISLHTVVVYTQNSTLSYCTISSNLSHNAGAIWAHLKPVLASLPETIENVHFLSDGPVTQYKNKSMFFILGCKLQEFYPNLIAYSWNYHEAGHGKGAPDGIGATCKRTADQVIAQGKDISNLGDFVSTLREKCQGIKIFVIEDEDISKYTKIIEDNKCQLIPFKGTLNVHQIIGNVYCPNRLTMKSLSCFCDINGCDHYRLGVLQYKTNIKSVDSVFSDSEDNEVSKASISDVLKGRLDTYYSNGDYILIKFVVNGNEYRYAAVCTNIDEDEGEITVTFLKAYGGTCTVFKLDESDVADVPMHQVVEKLPVPNLYVQGNRVFYKFKHDVNILEK